MEFAINRRDLFKSFAAAGALLQLEAAQPGAPLFFTKEEFKMLDTLTELIVPADEHSPGAHEAGVAGYIDKATAEAFLAEDKVTWKNGLAALNELARTEHRAHFSQIGHDKQLALLTKIARAEDDPKTAAEKFFTQLKQTTAALYYSSSIGIHKEIEYKGNVLLKEFVGQEAV